MRSASAFVASLRCCSATWLFAPRAEKPMSTGVPSSHFARIDFSGVDVVTFSGASSHFARFLASWKALNSVASGTAIVLLLLTCQSPPRREPRSRSPRMRS